MTWQFSVDVRNAAADAREVAIGPSAVIKIRTSALPANCAAADAGSVLVTINAPADWLAAAANGAKLMLGTWPTPLASGTGVAGHFRIYASDGTTCKGQGDVTAVGGGGAMTLDDVNVVTGRPIAVSSFGWVEGDA